MIKNNDKNIKVNEITYVESLLHSIENEQLQQRIENILLWYIIKSEKAKLRYYLFTLLSITTSILIPIVSLGTSTAELKDWIVSALSGIGAISVSVCALFSFKDNWRRYRKYAEKMKSECFKYISKTGKYKSESINSLEVFIEQIERLSASESEEWEELKMKNDYSQEN